MRERKWVYIQCSLPLTSQEKKSNNQERLKVYLYKVKLIKLVNFIECKLYHNI